MNIERLKEVFHVDYENGLLIRNVRCGKFPKGSAAGSSTKYSKVYVDKEHIYVHKAVWSIHHGYIPDETIDHIDTNPTNNKICNLRIATRSQQQHNTGIRQTNTTGVKGVSLCKLTGMYRAEVKLDHKRVFDKRFNTIEEAKEALVLVRQKFHGNFTNNGEKL